MTHATVQRATSSALIALALGSATLASPASALQAPVLEGDALIALDFVGCDVVRGDFDGNGWLDLAAVDKGASVHVVLALGRGAWAPRVSYPTGSSPLRVVTADMDGDADLDLVVSTLDSGQISILLGNGDGTFAAAIAVPVAPSAPSGDYRVAVADADGDLDLDVFAAAPDGILRLVPNLGGGAFGSAVTVPTGLLRVRSIATGDLDGDGDVDLALGTQPGTSCHSSATVTVWLNQGSGTFALHQQLQPTGCANQVVVADLDGDLSLDVAACGSDYQAGDIGFFRAWRNQGGTGTFVQVPTPYACHCNGLRLADVDGDGDRDAVMTIDSSACSADFIQVLTNDGAQFGTPVSYPTSDYPAALDVGDFDGDSDIDVAAIGAFPATLRVHFNRGDGRLSPQTDLLGTFTGAAGAAVADLDGDGDDDVVTIGGLAAFVSVHESTGDGALLPRQLYPTVQRARVIAPADVDGDLDVDLLIAGDGSSTGPTTMRVLFNDGTGVFAAAAATAPLGAGVTAVAAGDLDGDGDADAIVLDAADDVATVLVNAGNGTFSVLGTMPFANDPIALALADYDGNGTLDVAVARYQTTSFSVRLNTGTGLFGPPLQFPVGIHATSIVAFDSDGDGDVDLALARPEGGPISVYRNNGAASFAVSAQVPVASGSSLYGGTSLAALDVDADGDVDLATALPNRSGVYVMRNDGSGAFPSGFLHPGGNDAALVARARLDAGGADDLVLISSSWMTTARGSASSGAIACSGEPGAPCPCGNHAPAGSGVGCLHSFGVGGQLRGVGSTSLSSDRLVLDASQLPTTTAVLFFQGTAIFGGTGATFGDGVRCAGGSVRRLATRNASASQVSHPTLAEPRISATGLVTGPGTRVYQGWFRNAAAFCTGATFNLTNGLVISWGP